MVRHVIIWTIRDEYSDEAKARIREGVREGLESLDGKIPGLVSIRVMTEGLPSSTGDLMLDSLFEDQEALRQYTVNPLHVEVANGKVRPFMKIRNSFDFEE